jgi:hypothetical protein
MWMRTFQQNSIFFRAHIEERRKSATGLIVLRADSNQLLGIREISRQLGPVNSYQEGLQTK